MAANLSYENPAVVQRVVEQCWNMHFVKFFNCCKDYQKMHSTQAFICMDKSTDPNAVVVAFRGTEAFNTYDWSTDFDFSWVKPPGLGGLHLGIVQKMIQNDGGKDDFRESGPCYLDRKRHTDFHLSRASKCI